jgi:16S rRNA (cytosine1402-N4)-methyltransferase
MQHHTPVLLEEVLHFLNPQSGCTYIDATVGAGGHAEAILDRTRPDGRLLALDQDEDALALAAERLSEHQSRTVFRHANFSRIVDVANEEGFVNVDGIVADLGVSSMMLDQPERGFSFQSDGPLDMRMDRSGGTTASDIVNRMKEKELANTIYEYGEERRSRPIAGAIVRMRPHHTTGDLVRAIEAVTGKRRYGKIHPATRTFMALRLAVNDELGHLETLVNTAPSLLALGGRLTVISFHSLEDRIVKHRMRAIGRVLTKKVIQAGETERRANPRSRSAKLRALEKI